MTTQSPKTEVSKRMEAKAIAEDSAWVKHCNKQHKQLKSLLGRTPTDGEWLDRFNNLVEHWIQPRRTTWH